MTTKLTGYYRNKEFPFHESFKCHDSLIDFLCKLCIPEQIAIAKFLQLS